MEITLNISSKDEWISFNYGHTGFYRVNYTSKLWKNLARAVENNEVSHADSVGLLNDILTLSVYKENVEESIVREFTLAVRNKEYPYYFAIIKRFIFHLRKFGIGIPNNSDPDDIKAAVIEYYNLRVHPNQPVVPEANKHSETS